ncbi:MAG: endonuclease III, partial [Angelakisella sp.]
MNNKKRALVAIERLAERYPNAICSLEYTVPHELLIATRLSAQCTDARVNLVTPALFARYPTIQDFAEAELTDVEELVRTCGFYHTKAQDIINMCRMLITDFGGKLPDN